MTKPCPSSSPPKTLKYLNSRGYDAEDVVTWSWIVTSDHADKAIRRLIAVNEEKRSQGKAEVPRWVTLQLLRAQHINASAFTHLVSSLLESSASHPLLPDPAQPYLPVAHPCPEDYRNTSWDSDSATLLMVRLLRHARLVNPAAIEDIATLACRLVLPHRQHRPEGFERLCYACNRILSLTSLPAGVRPFHSVAHQQRAQLTLVKAMMQQNPEVPLNREGYRALIKVQLAHEKLDEEKVWVEAQGEGWPPWPKAKLGIEQGIEYPGKESRAMTVLRRMREAGYAHHTWEKVASVLAGWDTDRSPTIQTRHILRIARGAPLPEAFPHKPSSPLVAELWAARVIATRSVREAWACFTSYCKTVDKPSRRYEPYRAMFSKLIARQRTAQLGNKKVLPGDAKETFPDPSSPRDLVYIESQPPTVDSLL